MSKRADSETWSVYDFFCETKDKKSPEPDFRTAKPGSKRQIYIPPREKSSSGAENPGFFSKKNEKLTLITFLSVSVEPSECGKARQEIDERTISDSAWLSSGNQTETNCLRNLKPSTLSGRLRAGSQRLSRKDTLRVSRLVVRVLIRRGFKLLFCYRLAIGLLNQSHWQPNKYWLLK
jgi:hypothetical protein